MATIHPRFLVDENQVTQAVQISIEEWHRIVEELEELEDIRAYDLAKASGEKPIPFEQAMREIEEAE